LKIRALVIIFRLEKVMSTRA